MCVFEPGKRFEHRRIALNAYFLLSWPFLQMARTKKCDVWPHYLHHLRGPIVAKQSAGCVNRLPHLRTSYWDNIKAPHILRSIGRQISGRAVQLQTESRRHVHPAVRDVCSHDDFRCELSAELLS